MNKQHSKRKEGEIIRTVSGSIRIRPSSLTLTQGRILPDFSWLLNPTRTEGRVLVDASADGSQSMATGDETTRGGRSKERPAMKREE